MATHTEQIFFEVFEPLPRQGPGNLASTQRALACCAALPPSPHILDLGCGAGAQTLDLASLTSGHILAVESHPPLIERLRRAAGERDLSERIEATPAAPPDVRAAFADYPTMGRVEDVFPLLAESGPRG